jgi:hypothetical protein
LSAVLHRIEEAQVARAEYDRISKEPWSTQISGEDAHQKINGWNSRRMR